MRTLQPIERLFTRFIRMVDSEIKKLYYAIGEVSEMMGLEPHVLRYWESEFEQLRPRKNRAGRRVYTEDDIAVVRHVQHLLREEKYTIEGARQVLARESVGDREDAEYRAQLTDLRAFLAQLRQALGREEGQG